MALTGEAAAKRNFDERRIGLHKEPLGAFDPPLQYEAMRRFAELPPERTGKIIGIYVRHFGHRIQCQFAIHRHVDVVDHAAEL